MRVESELVAKATVERLNERYIEAFLNADVAWYAEHLADDFIFIDGSGAVFGKSEFLTQAATKPDISDYKLQDVHVRIFGETAVVQAAGLFTRPDGSAGVSRYTDIYVSGPGGWRVVSAQVTRGRTFGTS